MMAIPKKRVRVVQARIDDDLHARVKARAVGGNVSAVIVTALEVYDAVAGVLEGRRI